MKKNKEEYQCTVRKYAQNGWRLVPVTEPNILNNEYELVFEKEANERDVLR